MYNYIDFSILHSKKNIFFGYFLKKIKMKLSNLHKSNHSVILKNCIQLTYIKIVAPGFHIE